MITIEDIDNEANKANISPTEKQREAGNYAKGHISIKGMRIAIENPKGSKRYYGKGTQYTVMKNHYGYFNITKGKDGDAVDVFIGPHIEDFDRVFCIDQLKSDGTFDETKVMLGFKSKEEAKDAYMSNYSPGWKGFGNITSVSVKDFKKWLYRGRKQRQPFADYVYIQKKKLDESTVLNEKNGVIDEKFLSIADWIIKRARNAKPNKFGVTKFTIPSNIFSKYSLYYDLPFKNLKVRIVDSDQNPCVATFFGETELRLPYSLIYNEDIPTIAHELLHVIQEKNPHTKGNARGHWTLSNGAKEIAERISYDFDPNELSARISEAYVYLKKNFNFFLDGVRWANNENMTFSEFYEYILSLRTYYAYHNNSLAGILRIREIMDDLKKLENDSLTNFKTGLIYSIYKFQNKKPSFSGNSPVLGLFMSRPWYLKKIIQDYTSLLGTPDKKAINGNRVSLYTIPHDNEIAMWFVVLKGKLTNYFEAAFEDYKKKISKALAPAIKDIYDEIMNMKDNKHDMKTTIRLNESDLMNVIKNAVKKIINENKLTRDNDFSGPEKPDDEYLDSQYDKWKEGQPTQKDWDDFSFWASSDEPDLVNDEIGNAYDREHPLLDADDEGSGYSRDYYEGVKYAKNLIAKSRVPKGLVDELIQKENDNIISAYELGILDTLDEEQ